MHDINISQADADKLIAMQKFRVENSEIYPFPTRGSKLSIPLKSSDGSEQFHLDIERNKINLLKGKYQNRARRTIVLIRLDFGGSPHRNPNDEEVPSPHLHIYKENFGDKWAIPVPTERFSNIDNLLQTLEEFMRYCNIIEPPIIQRGLFYDV